MRLLGKNIIIQLQKNQAVGKWLSSWTSELTNARWWCSEDLIKQFPNAWEQDTGLFLFETDPKIYRIGVQMAFIQGIAVITTLIELKEDNSE